MSNPISFQPSISRPSSPSEEILNEIQIGAMNLLKKITIYELQNKFQSPTIRAFAYYHAISKLSQAQLPDEAKELFKISILRHVWDRHTWEQTQLPIEEQRIMTAWKALLDKNFPI